MRNVAAFSVLVGLTCSVGCGRSAPEPAPSKPAAHDSLFHYHFIGSGQVAQSPASAKLKQIWALPQTQPLVNQTLDKLARAPRTLYPAKVTPEQNGRGAVLLRPLLGDLLPYESVFDLRGPPGQTPEWTLAIHLPPDRAKNWRSTIGEFVEALALGRLATNVVEGFPAWEFKRFTAPNLFRLVDAGPWQVLGLGQDKLGRLEEFVRRIKASGRPVAAADRYWLAAQADLPRLARWLSLTPAIKWPNAQLSVMGQGENLRSTMELAFNEPVTGPIEPWKVPTRIICEPLTSFTAARGIAPWLKDSPMLKRLGLETVPNEAYFWSQAHVVSQAYLAFPATDTTNTLKRIGERAPTLFDTHWVRKGLAQISWQATNNEVSWAGLPFVAPFLRPARDAGSDFIVGGLFPPALTTNPPPPELVGQIMGNSKLVYYDWEITQARLYQARILAQLAAVIANEGQLMTNTAGLPWLMNVETNLGNCVTEITAASPKDWSFVRKSHIGFTGMELVALTRWLESTNFPKLSLELPSPLPRAKNPSPP